MMYELIVSIIFRFINFGVLIVLFGYLFKKYMLDIILQKIAERKALIRGMRMQVTVLEREQQGLEAAIVQDVALCEQLQQKVCQWREVVDAQLAAREQEKDKRAAALNVRMEKQAEYLVMQHIKKQALPHALERAQQQLQTHFTDKKAGQEFMAKLVEHMQKSEQ